MKKLLLFCTIGLVLASCGRKDGEARMYACNCEQKAKVAEHIATSIKNANNMSDEEMEDVIEQLEKTYVHIICSQKIVKGTTNFEGDDFRATQLDSCETYHPLY